MTMYGESLDFPIVSNRALRWAQSSSPSAQALFTTSFSAVPLSLSLLQTTLNFKTPSPLSLQNNQSSIPSLEICFSDIQTWMLVNKINMTKQRLSSSAYFSSNFQSLNLKPSVSVAVKHTVSSSATNLGFYITVADDTSVKVHTQKTICRLPYIEISCISSVRHLLSIDSAKTFVCASIFSRLDYCNSFLSRCPKP